MIPSLFIAHGAPLLAIEDNEYTQFLQNLGRTMPNQRQLLCFQLTGFLRYKWSVMWMSTVPSMISEDFQMHYIKFNILLKETSNLRRKWKNYLQKVEYRTKWITSRGLDHGAWVVLRLLYPNADIPVISMSVSPNLSPEEQYKVGQSLSELRENDVLVIGSGGTVHNLRAVKWADNGEDDWALGFDEWLAQHLENWDAGLPIQI